MKSILGHYDAGGLLVGLNFGGVDPAKSLLGRRFWACLLVSCLLTQRGIAQQKLDELLVHGDNFAFSVKEPAGWKGDTKGAAEFQSNLVLREIGQTSNEVSGMIRIRVNGKKDENTQADIEEDIRAYRAQYPKVQFKDLSVASPRYRCLAKVFYVPGLFYEYVAYVNPGPGKPLLFSVAMNTQKVEATAKELGAYKSAVESLTLLKP